MFFVDLLVAFIVAVVLTVIFATVFRNTGPWGIWWVFLLVVLLATWAGGLWLAPFGPTIFDVAWAPFLLVGLIVSLLMAAVVPAARPPEVAHTHREAVAEARAEQAAIATFSVFLWILIFSLIVIIALGYIV
jgi:hypothetical protein